MSRSHISQRKSRFAVSPQHQFGAIDLGGIVRIVVVIESRMALVVGQSFERGPFANLQSSSRRTSPTMARSLKKKRCGVSSFTRSKSPLKSGSYGTACTIMAFPAESTTMPIWEYPLSVSAMTTARLDKLPPLRNTRSPARSPMSDGIMQCSSSLHETNCNSVSIPMAYLKKCFLTRQMYKKFSSAKILFNISRYFYHMQLSCGIKIYKIIRKWSENGRVLGSI